jgi:hypothetical protein
MKFFMASAGAVCAGILLLIAPSAHAQSNVPAAIQNVTITNEELLRELIYLKARVSALESELNTEKT